MADEPQLPQPASTPAPRPEHRTLVLSDPPPEKHHTLLWGLCVLAVALTTGGLVYAFWQATSPVVDESVVATQQEEIAVTTVPILNSKGKETYFSTDGAHVYITYGRQPAEVIRNADPQTFEWVDYDYAKDKNNVYIVVYGDVRVVEGADPATFMSLGWVTDSGHFYGKDANNVYFGDKVVEAANPQTFVLSDYSEIYDAEDAYNKFSEEHIMDLATFQIIYTQDGKKSGYAKDQRYVYVQRFEGSQYSVVSEDPRNFVLLGTGYSGYSKDSANVYFLEKGAGVVPNAATSSFMSFDPYYYGKDKDRVYRQWESIDFNPSTFVALNYSYVKDATKVCFFTIEIESTRCPIAGADANTFTLVEGQADYDAQDKNHKYLVGEIVE